MSLNEDPSTWNLATLGGIPLKLLSSTYEFGEEDGTGQEVYLMESRRLTAFVVESYPQPFIFFGTVFYPRKRYMPGLPSLVTKRIKAKGYPDGKPVDPFLQYTAIGDWSAAFTRFIEVTVDYGTSMENDEERDPNNPWTFLEVSSHAAGQYLATSTRNSEWTDDAGASFPIPQPVTEADLPNTVTENLVEHTTKWSQIPYAWYYAVLVPRLRELMGKINSVAMPFFFDAPIGTILFQTYSTQEQHTWRAGYAGASPVDLELSFLEKNFEGQSYDPAVGTVQVNHNYFYRPGMGWQRIKINGKDPHPSGDLNAMFAP